MNEIVREMTREELVAFNNELRAENEKLKAELQEMRLAVEHNRHFDRPDPRNAISIYGYNVEHLELIARILRKEDLPPERVVEALTDIGRIVEMVENEFEESLRKTLEQSVERKWGTPMIYKERSE